MEVGFEEAGVENGGGVILCVARPNEDGLDLVVAEGCTNACWLVSVKGTG